MLSTWPVIQPLPGEASSVDHRGDVAGLAEPAHRIELHQLLAVRLHPVLVVIGLDQPERDRVGGGAGAAELARERLHQRDHAGARRRHDREPRLADARGIADETDDAAVLRVSPDAARRRGSNGSRRRGTRRSGCASPSGVVSTKRWRFASPALLIRILSAPKSFTTCADHRGHGGEIRDIGLVGLGLAAGRRDLGRERIGILRRRAIVDRDARAFARQGRAAISRPTPRPAPVTSATLPFSPRSIVPSSLASVCARAASIRRNRRSGVTGSSLISMPERRRARPRPRSRPRPARRSCHLRPCRGSRRAWSATSVSMMHHVHRRNLAGRRHQVVDQARGVQLALARRRRSPRRARRRSPARRRHAPARRRSAD